MASPVARRLRKSLTEAEKRLWARVRDRQLGGFRFRRQAPIGNYVVDFVCYERKIVVELDGGQHAERTDADAERTAWLEGEGFRVVRYWNNEVLENFEGVLENLLAELDG